MFFSLVCSTKARLRRGLNSRLSILRSCSETRSGSIPQKFEESHNREFAGYAVPFLFVRGDQLWAGVDLAKINNDIVIPEVKAANRQIEEIIYPRESSGAIA